MEPKNVRFMGYVGEDISQKVKIVPQNGHTFTVKDVKANRGENISVKLAPIGSAADKKGYELTVTCTRKEKGSFGDLILLTTDSKYKPTIRIPVSGRIYAKVDPPAESGKTGK